MDKKEFIDRVVLDWMKNDLLRMKSLVSSVYQNGNINFPLALCVVAYMECLGQYLLGDTEATFIESISEYINICFINPKEYNALIIKDLIRNSLAHSYLPYCAISRNGKHPAIYKGETYPIVLDAETLANDFINSLDNFISNLEEEKYEKITIKRSNEIDKFMEKYKDFISGLNKQPGNDYQATPSSGPSGPYGPIN